MSPTLEEEHEDSKTCSNINEANETPETIHKKENDWEVDPMIPSKELDDQSHTIVNETKLEVSIAISGVEKAESMELESNNVENTQQSCMCVNTKHSHFPPTIHEQAQETDPTLDTDGVTKIVERLATINGTHTTTKT